MCTLLKECKQNFEVQAEHDIRESECEASPEAELPFDERGRLELKELCYQELVSEIPSVLLCSEDCKGYARSAAAETLVLAHRKPTAMLWMKGLLY